jgi:hypothetical protein
VSVSVSVSVSMSVSVSLTFLTDVCKYKITGKNFVFDPRRFEPLHDASVVGRLPTKKI